MGFEIVEVEGNVRLDGSIDDNHRPRIAGTDLALHRHIRLGDDDCSTGPDDLTAATQQVADRWSHQMNVVIGCEDGLALANGSRGSGTGRVVCQRRHDPRMTKPVLLAKVVRHFEFGLDPFVSCGDDTDAEVSDKRSFVEDVGDSAGKVVHVVGRR